MQFHSLTGTPYAFEPMSNKIFSWNSKNHQEKYTFPDFCTQFSIVPPTKEYIEEMVNNYAGNLMLELTDRCNCRCRYCVFSGRFYHERCHGNSCMDRSLARKAIELFYCHATKAPQRVINFYGGEPLLERELLLELVEYARKIDNAVRFHISTNLTLVNEDFVRKCVENCISMTATLDGPRDIHDQWRPFADGTGTFDTVIKNLTMIYKKFPDYYKESFAIIFNLAPETEVSKVIDFIGQDPIVRQARQFRLNPIELADSDMEMDAKAQDFIIDDRHLCTYVSWLLYPEQTVPVLHHLLWPGVRALLFREHNPKSLISLNHCCIPGKHRMFVNLKGNISPCEKCGEYLLIGHVDKGLDTDRIWNLISTYYEQARTVCPKCPIARFCNLCFVWCKKGYDMDFERKAVVCEERKKYISTCLRVLVSVLEKNPEFRGVYA